MARERRRWTVSGRVQGVGYRYFVVRQALALGLVGWVRNRPDGSVEAAAAGEGEALDRLERALEEGPPRSAVASVRRREGPESLDDAVGFEIEY